MNIVILDDYQDAVRKLACASKLEGLNAKVYNNSVKGIGQLVMRLRDADAVIVIHERTCITAQLLEKLPRLRLIALAGQLGPHIDVAACTAHGVAVAQGYYNPTAVAELTWALVMGAMRRLPQYVAHLKHGAWQQAGLKAASMPTNFGLGIALESKTLGIWGYGRIGRLVAQYGKAFGMQVLVWGSQSSRDQAVRDGFDTTATQEALFESADVLSLHLQLSSRTRYAVTLQDLLLMRPTALFVNTAQAQLLAPDALLLALQQGRPGMAAVDVFEAEPILQGHALLRQENCICTPHIGHVEQDNYERMLGTAFDNVLNFLQGQPTQIVNPEVLKT